MTDTLNKTLSEISASSECMKHVRPVTLLDINRDGNYICPTCELEKINEAVNFDIGKKAFEGQVRERKAFLKNYSLVNDETLHDATIENYVNKNNEQEVDFNLSEIKMLIEEYKAGETFATLLTGNTGAGKSHLAMSMLKELKESKRGSECLFLSVRDMISTIKDSWDNKDNHMSEGYFMEKCKRAEFLVLDDLGAEVGSKDTDKKASDFTQTIVTQILESRLGKPVIVTSNLDSVGLKKMYEQRFISRLLGEFYSVTFLNTKDKRIKKFIPRSRR